ncbi:hypothetical protein RKE30_38085 [Streptomyces sp. Li-HN-5-11]|uniref:hypothetical protein n=1 Tax=Streptomyces sp. Li-HN-5-11 TaxID=3075432 RepID=UPI0028A65CE3|nr:hypothetical protein [Streptomyces sp. Li-HN-5-11]WNM35763.1 hypothetical protein RKE30_38085 [Streptomyces sp. Li-HN-5-11]
MPLMPDGGPERERSRAHQAAARPEPVCRRLRAIAVDGKCLRTPWLSGEGEVVFYLQHSQLVNFVKGFQTHLSWVPVGGNVAGIGKGVAVHCYALVVDLSGNRPAYRRTVEPLIRRAACPRKGICMRKRLALVSASAVAVIGVGLAMASPASAETFGTYQTQAECEAAKAARGGVNSYGEPLECHWYPWTPSDGGNYWELVDHRGGG